MATVATKSNLQIVQDAYDLLLGQGNLDAFCEFFDDETVMSEAASLPYGGTFKGRDAIKGGIQAVFGYYSAFGYDVHQLTEGGNFVIAYGTFSATSATNGKSVSFPLAEVWEFGEGGRIKMIQPVYSDTAAVVAILNG